MTGISWTILQRIFELDSGNLIEYQGNYQDYLRQKLKMMNVNQPNSIRINNSTNKNWPGFASHRKHRATKQQARIDHFEDIKRGSKKCDEIR